MHTDMIFRIIEILIIPISIGIAGIIISKRIESKNNWSTKWSENFFQLFQEFNVAVEDLINCMFNFSVICKRNGPTKEQENKFLTELRKINANISRKEFGMRTQLCFAVKSKADIISLSEKLREQINVVILNKKGSIDDIHKTLIELNRKAKIAHSEILGLKNKYL